MRLGKMDLPEVVNIAESAGRAIMGVRGSLNTTEKSDSSPVTQADILAHKLIAGRLRELTPDIPIVSEEGYVRSRLESFWLVDPLDGTREFINGHHDFTVNIALIKDSKPVLGVVHTPMTGETYYGDEDGAIKTRHGISVSIVISSRVDNPRALVSRSHLDDETQDFLENLEHESAIQAGSSMKFCLIAEGKAEIYPRFGRTMEWDTAAAHAVLTAAGGQVLVAKTGEELAYGKPGFENPGFIAISNPAILAGKKPRAK